MTTILRYALLLPLLLLGLFSAPSYGTTYVPEYLCEPDAGELRNGKKHGHWVEHECPGPECSCQAGSYVDGKKQGHWVETTTRTRSISLVPFLPPSYTLLSRGTEEGPYVNGKRHGHWVELTDEWQEDLHGDRVGNSGSEEGPYVNGKRHGHWVERHSEWQEDQHGDSVGKNGSEEGSYMNGKRHGHWVEQLLNGDVREGPYVDGERHGRWMTRAAGGWKLVRCWANGEIIACQ